CDSHATDACMDSLGSPPRPKSTGRFCTSNYGIEIANSGGKISAPCLCHNRQTDRCSAQSKPNCVITRRSSLLIQNAGQACPPSTTTGDGMKASKMLLCFSPTAHASYSGAGRTTFRFGQASTIQVYSINGPKTVAAHWYPIPTVAGTVPNPCLTASYVTA